MSEVSEKAMDFLAALSGQEYIPDVCSWCEYKRARRKNGTLNAPLNLVTVKGCNYLLCRACHNRIKTKQEEIIDSVEWSLRTEIDDCACYERYRSGLQGTSNGYYTGSRHGYCPHSFAKQATREALYLEPEDESMLEITDESIVAALSNAIKRIPIHREKYSNSDNVESKK